MSSPAPSPASSASSSEQNDSSSNVTEGSREQIEFKYLKANGDPKEHAACESALASLMKSSPVVKFMMESLAKAGCPFSPEHFVCSPCNPENKIAGGFHDQSKLPTSFPSFLFLLTWSLLSLSFFFVSAFLSWSCAV